jgi:hypothetical protein
MKKWISILGLAAFLYAGAAFSQNSSAAPRKWGIEAELIQPFIPTVGIMRIQVTRMLTAPAGKGRGDLLIGGYIRPNVKHEIVEKINEYLFMVGYRQYFWKGFHAEAKSNLGYAWGTKNLIDGRDYNKLSWFWEANAGYKLAFGKQPMFNLYVIPQFGILSSISADIGPRGGRPDTFLQGNLLLGVNF